MDPRTLETFGEYDFEGQWEGKTFTAHPKYDPLTRELVAFGYEAKGLMSEDNYYGSLDQHGRLTEQVWFKAPYCGFQHEMAITENYVGSLTPGHSLMSSGRCTNIFRYSSPSFQPKATLRDSRKAVSIGHGHLRNPITLGYCRDEELLKKTSK